MNEIYVFIDETGDLGTSDNSARYFIITAIWTEKPEQLDRLIKNIRRNKFHKDLKDVHELKANNSSRELREYLLKKFNELNSVMAHSVILEKKKVKSEFLKEDKHKLYNYVCGSLALNMAIGGSKKIIIRVDKSKGKNILRADFNQYIQKKLRENCWYRQVEVYHSWSHSWAGIQITDFVSWAVFQKFERENDYYFRLIEKKTNISHVWE